MAKRTVIEAKSPPMLVIPRTDAHAKLSTQLDRGKEIQSRQISTVEIFEKAKIDKEKWRDYVAEMLVRFFDNDSVQQDFVTAYGPMRMAMNVGDQIDNFKNDINAKLTALESIIERLDLIPESMTPASVPEQESHAEISKDVFIVHGHETEIKEEVARFISGAGLTPIILHEQPNGGRTLIEKLEQFSAVGFAVVLITPDDMGHPKNFPQKILPRARQNVVSELGFFVGKLGRKNVAVLYTEGVELPSDFLGVVYIPLRDTDGWKLGLAKEVKNAGLPVDLNKII